MDNASQALLIAGGVLLGIITITLLVYMFGSIAEMGNAQAMKNDAERLAAWNAEWEAYNKKFLYGTEVLTVMNKADQNNKEYADDVKYQMTIYGKDKNGNNLSAEEFRKMVTQNKTSIYTCVDVTYGSEGRVNSMTFKFEE